MRQVILATQRLRGDVWIKTNVGCSLTLKNVVHIVGLGFNPFSIHPMGQVGYYSHFGNGRWKRARGNARCSMYKTHVKTNDNGLI